MLDRSIPPPIHEISQLNLPPVREWKLDNGIPVYSIQAGTQAVVRVELVFRAGRVYELKRMAARAATSLLKEGSQNYSAAELAEQFDFYGSNISFPFSLDTTNSVLYSLNRHLDRLLPIWMDMLTQPAYTEKALQSFIRRNQRLLREDLEKVDVVAFREVTEKIFGDRHPYGYNSSLDDYAGIQRADVVAHHQRCFSPASASLIVSGQVDHQVEQLLNRHIGQWQKAQAAPLPILPETGIARSGPPPQDRMYTHLQKPDAVQTALRIGRKSFNRKHPDYAHCYLLDQVLGGYFGSRLMKNIREDKGYTYGIYSILDANHYDGCWYISAEVSPDNVGACMREIHHEMEQLCSTKVKEEELSMLRSYLRGSFLSMLDGPFNLAELIHTLVVNDLPYAYFSQLVESVNHCTAEQLRTLAEQYLQPKDWLVVEVGP